jgi:hypothetical protein
LCRGGRRGEGKKGADAWGPLVRERKERNGARAGERKVGRLLSAREKGGEGELGWAKALGCFFSLFFSFFLSTLKPFKPFHLNSNKFEFKPNTNKTMHQHECASNLIL